MSTGQRALVVAALRDLFDSLELISTTHDEVFDTDVREDVARALNYYFVWGAPRDRFPRYFGMFTADGNQAVAQAVRRFLERTDQMAFAIPKGQARHDVLYRSSVRSSSGRIHDEFIGDLDTVLDPAPIPEHHFESDVLSID